MSSSNNNHKNHQGTHSTHRQHQYRITIHHHSICLLTMLRVVGYASETVS